MSIILAEGIVINTGIAVAVVTALAGAISMLFKLVMDSKNAQIKALNDQIAGLVSIQKSYEEMADEAIKSAKDTLNFYRQQEGKPPVIFDAKVISESHSPSTALQRLTADIATKRAALAKIKLTADQEPRVEPERAEESGKESATKKA